VQNLVVFGQKISSYSVRLFLTMALAALAGCGGGSPVPAGGTPGAPGTPTAATVQLLASSSQMPSSGAGQIDVTAVVLSGTKQAVANRTVTFSTGADNSAFFNNISAAGVSDANGLVTAKLNLGSNHANRTITLSATADGATGTNSVDVTGTTIGISGSSSLSSGATGTLTVSIKDSAGAPLQNVTVTVASQTGNILTPANGVTNSAGQITADVTASKTGNDVITATAAGASKTQSLSVSGDSFAFSTPSDATQIPLNTPTAVSIKWTNLGNAVVGSQVSFSATRGTITASAATDASGNTPGVSIISASAGTAIISAAGPGGTPAATLNVVFVAASASSVALQALPGTVQPTTTSTSQTNNTATISAVVRDAANNLVKDARVNFTITADPSVGSLSAASAITDISGSASVNYIAGTTSSPQNGVKISATVVDIKGVPLATPVTNSVALTVGGQALFVRLGTDNTVGTSTTNSAAYAKTYNAIVTDAVGNPAPLGTEVRFALRPNRYTKGFYAVVGTAWAQTVTVSPDCNNEDLNFNGLLDPGEDKNGSLALDPGGVASVTASAASNASGFATAIISYPKDHATWVEIVLEARAGVAGNDPPTNATFWLPGAAPDYNNKDIPPPGQRSPYGVGNVCTNTN
jgi:hypothetical protein